MFDIESDYMTTRSKQEKQRIGIMGGTFNPVHTGHLILAEKAYEQLKLDTVWMMPNAMPPHKAGQQILAKEHRIAMLELAIANNPHFQLSLFERENRTHYSYETMEALKEAYPDCAFYYLMGADSLFDIEKWVEYRRFLAACHVLVAGRRDEKNRRLEDWAKTLKETYQARITLLDSPVVDISSSEIRKLRGEGKSIRYLVPEQVFSYIENHGLYTNLEEL